MTLTEIGRHILESPIGPGTSISKPSRVAFAHDSDLEPSSHNAVLELKLFMTMPTSVQKLRPKEI